jgi:ribosomal protein S18 acetylase RimI-like enzyme
MAQITIRQAVMSDLDVLLGFEQAVVEAERPFDPTLKSEGARYYDIEELISAPHAEILVAEVAGQIIGSGYAQIKKPEAYLKHKQYAYLGFMYVVPEYRGRGVNKIIIDALVKWSHEQNVPEVRLEVYARNAAAIRAYEKVGFVAHQLEMRLDVRVRNAESVEIDHLAQLWYDGWQDAHAQILPVELARIRTLESFRERLEQLLPSVRVMGPVGRPLGLCITKGDELYQLYVSAEARGKGVAASLIADGENRLKEDGVDIAWLACAIGNERAARFYEKSGWYRAGNMVSQLEISDGLFPLEVWRYEKTIKLSV